jgi:hypothetical protein
MEFADVFEFNEGFSRLDYDQVVGMGLASVDSAKAESRAAMSEVTVGDNLDAVLWAFQGKDRAKDQRMLSEVVNENGTQGTGNVRVTRAGDTDTSAAGRKAALEAVKAAVGKLDDVVVGGLLRGIHLSTLPQLLAYHKFEQYTGCHPDLFQEVIDSGWVNPYLLNSRVSRMHLSLSTALEGAL